jgi:DNA-binding response OmpR family regulator
MKNVALVVEEEALVCSLITHVLAIFDFEVFHAESELNALSLFNKREKEYRYIYIDYNLRKGNGLKLYQTIRERNPSVLIVIASGMPDNNLLVLNSDVNSLFLPKPFSLDDLIKSVQRTMETQNYEYDDSQKRIAAVM